jgi:hypothetical protein
MASFVAKIVGKKILGETLQNKFGKEDPYFEQVPATRLDGKPGKKMKKRRRALPPGISEHDAQVLTKVKRRAYRLDMALFSFMGIRFGWGSVIGIVPAVGDVCDALLALMVFKTCGQIEGGLPAGIKIHMLLNIIFDFVIGIVPFLGDVLDAIYRANTRNAVLLENHLREVGQKNLKKSGQPVPSVDPSLPDEFDRADDLEPSQGSDHQQSGVMPATPEPARTGNGRGYFGRNKARPADVETGMVENPSRSKSKRQNRTSERR